MKGSVNSKQVLGAALLAISIPLTALSRYDICEQEIHYPAPSACPTGAIHVPSGDAQELQYQLSYAAPYSVICLDPGTYVPQTPRIVGEPRSATFLVEVEGLTIQGAGMSATTLSGNLGQDGNAYNVMLVDNVGSTVTSLTVKNLKIADGLANILEPGFPNLKGSGGGINMANMPSGSVLTVEGVHFDNNVAFDVGGAILTLIDLNAAIPQAEQSKLIVKHSKFTNNRGGAFVPDENSVVGDQDFGQGGAIFGLFVELELKDSQLINNSAVFSGGAADILEASADIQNNHFIDGRAVATSGAVRVLVFAPFVTGDIRVSNNCFDGNQVTGIDERGLFLQRGGAMLIEGLTDRNSTAIFSHNSFKNNSSVGPAGAMEVLNGNTEIISNTFYNNSSGLEAGAVLVDGTPLEFRGGLAGSSAKITANVFKGNDAMLQGGALVVAESYVPLNELFEVIPTPFVINNNLFLYNKSQTEGGAISASARSVTTSYNTFIGNKAKRINPETGALTGTGGAIVTASAARHQGLFQFIAPDLFAGDLSELKANLTVNDSLFLFNTAGRDGGAIADTFDDQVPKPEPNPLFGAPFMSDTTAPGLATININDSVFLRNKAKNGVGGAIAIVGKGQQAEYILCPFGDPGLCPPGGDIFFPWSPRELDENGNPIETLFSTLNMSGSIVIFNKAGQGGADGNDVFFDSNPYPVNITDSLIRRCDGSASCP